MGLDILFVSFAHSPRSINLHRLLQKGRYLLCLSNLVDALQRGQVFILLILGNVYVVL